MPPMHIDPWIAIGVVLATAATDAVSVMFTAAVAGRRRVPAASWSGCWYLLSSFAVISYTSHWFYIFSRPPGPGLARIYRSRSLIVPEMVRRLARWVRNRRRERARLRR